MALKAKNRAKKNEALNQLVNLELDLDSYQKKYLNDSGWEYTCSTPGAVWMWRIKWNRVMLIVTQPEAIRIQKYWDGL